SAAPPVVAEKQWPVPIGARREVGADRGQAVRVEEDDPLLVALSQYERAVGPAVVDVDAVKGGDLSAPQARPVKRQQQRAVAQQFQAPLVVLPIRGGQWQ